MAKTPKDTSNRTPLLEMAEEARKSYEQALRTGLKLQHEAAQWWSKSLQHAVPTPDWQKRLAKFTSTASTVIPTARKQLEEVLNLLERNNRSCVELVRQATEAAQTPGLAESQVKWIEFWKSSVAAARSHAEALAEVNARMIDLSIDFLKKSSQATDWRGDESGLGRSG